tara:strand:+ start:254 stop:448 length:195 start_codon:yes stop_codon:yes gene_type:complete
MKFAEIKENQVLAQKQAKLASLESSLDKMETALGAAREATNKSNMIILQQILLLPSVALQMKLA